MGYRKLIRRELRRIAVNMPYHKAIIAPANVFQAVSFRLAKILPGVRHSEFTLSGYMGKGFRVDIFEPAGGDNLPCLIYVHGGAFSYKAAAYHKKLACRYALETQCRVYFPHYHLLPRYRHPAAYEDVLALYRYVSGGQPASKIAIGADSAGGAIAALVTCRCDGKNLMPPAAQMLIYPVTDAAMESESMKQFTDTPLWNAKNNRRMWRYYCDDLSASPMHCPLPEAIPPTYIETAQYDCLHDEGVAYAERLSAAGAAVELNETEGTIHGFELATGSEIAAESIARRVRFLRRALHGEG